MTLFSVLASVASARGTRRDLQGLVARRSVGRRIRSQRIAEYVVHAGAGSDDGSAFVCREIWIDVQGQGWKIIIRVVVVHELGTTLQRYALVLLIRVSGCEMVSATLLGLEREWGLGSLWGCPFSLPGLSAAT
jgi:hypothetical protein